MFGCRWNQFFGLRIERPFVWDSYKDHLQKGTAVNKEGEIRTLSEDEPLREDEVRIVDAGTVAALNLCSPRQRRRFWTAIKAGAAEDEALNRARSSGR